MNKVSRLTYKESTIEGKQALVSLELASPSHSIKALVFPTEGFFWCLQGKSIANEELSTLAKGTASTMLEAKKKIKAKLRELGVSFNEEVRVKRLPKESDKGPLSIS